MVSEFSTEREHFQWLEASKVESYFHLGDRLLFRGWHIIFQPIIDFGTRAVFISYLFLSFNFLYR